ncbi:AarF/UbiB family protein [Pelagicoccus sp. SDUM812002]|uniref:ABC1 kinase family protein n=1 Tax=Pelagicoccus sp. SDUM812002 TaxID=3041266 RepID=UPI00280F87C4|nr:AarF/UbiB family protein [Pelagicoccus sp. SDUM812002]MDQ8187614.1 AarF/UbiB family protein [Pelagicoccus sp. SDUM812002]
MTLSPKHLQLYQKIAWLFIKYAKPAIVEQANFGAEAKAETSKDKEAPEKFASSLEEMGPTFVKLGQLISTRGDLLPKRYIESLERLQDDVDPLPIETIREALETELNVRISKAFQSFEDTPIASASLGQVHRAVLRDGTEVVVKVQRPDVTERINTDLEALSAIADYADNHSELGQRYRFSGIIEQFQRSIADELDYTLEAQNLNTMREIVKDYPRLIVPKPVDGYCSAKVLTMEMIDGVKVTDLSGVAMTELDGEALAEEMFKAYLRQVLVVGFYHSDPHPGNVLVTRDHRVALIDLGMVGRLSESMRDKLFSLLTGICEKDADRVCDVALKMTDSPAHAVSRTLFTGEIADLLGRAHDAQVQQLKFGSVVMDVMRICAEQGLEIPRELSLLGKTLLNLDRVGMALAPTFNPNASIQRNLNSIARERSLNSLKQGDLLSMLLEFKELISRSPQRVNDILGLLAENRLRIDVDAVDEVALIRGFQKIANRIAMGAIIGAMIVGASLMMDIETGFSIFGYPGFPMSIMIVSGILALGFTYTVLSNDK